MKYTCSHCGRVFDSRWDCERHEKTCVKEKKSKSYVLALVLENRDRLEFHWSTYTDLEVGSDGSICYVNYQDEDGHDLYIIGCRCTKETVSKAKRALIRAMKNHLRDGIKRLSLSDGIKDYAEFEEDSDED